MGAAHIGSEVNGISAGVTTASTRYALSELASSTQGKLVLRDAPLIRVSQRWADHVSLVPTNNDQSFSPHDKEYIYSHLPAHSAQALRSIDVRECVTRSNQCRKFLFLHDGGRSFVFESGILRSRYAAVRATRRSPGDVLLFGRRAAFRVMCCCSGDALLTG